jgi:hypothetical protein
MATLTLRPNGASITQIPFVIGTTYNWQAESDSSDSTYIYDTTSYHGGTAWADGDLYTQQGHTTESGTITNVTFYVRGKRINNGGGGLFNTYWRTYGSDYAGAGWNPTNITTESTSKNTNSHTLAAWTWAEIDALLIGVGIQDVVSADDVYAYDVWAVVTYTPGGTANTEILSSLLGLKAFYKKAGSKRALPLLGLKSSNLFKKNKFLKSLIGLFVGQIHNKIWIVNFGIKIINFNF